MLSGSDALVSALERCNVKASTARRESSAVQAAEVVHKSEQLVDSALVAACRRVCIGPVSVEKRICSTTKASKARSALVFNVRCTRPSARTLNTRGTHTEWQELCQARATRSYPESLKFRKVSSGQAMPQPCAAMLSGTSLF
eukprot:TRINITY_DN5740_c0_g1_i6.p1 TRINITY_DN5740_c0_g1~~TRINITY_DN5740_c0_g1_i6.p1  ORF type:complete len:142 (-),score=18.69 TRINITY_DN5740_c0_g1_i6:355-780(-)